MGGSPDAACALERHAHWVSAASLVLHLTLEPGEALTGSLAGAPGEEAMAFSGWLGLLEALEVARRRAGHVGGEPSAPEVGEAGEQPHRAVL